MAEGGVYVHLSEHRRGGAACGGMEARVGDAGW